MTSWGEDWHTLLFHSLFFRSIHSFQWKVRLFPINFFDLIAQCCSTGAPSCFRPRSSWSTFFRSTAPDHNQETPLVRGLCILKLLYVKIFSLKELLSVLSVARCSSHCSCSNRYHCTFYPIRTQNCMTRRSCLFPPPVCLLPCLCGDVERSKFRTWPLTFHSLCTDRHCSIASRTQTFHSYLLMVNTSHTVAQSKMTACTFLRHFSLTPTAPLPTTNLMDHVSHRYSLG